MPRRKQSNPQPVKLELNKSTPYTMSPKKGLRNKTKNPRPRFSEGQGDPEVPEEEAAGDGEEVHQRRDRGRRIQGAASAPDEADTDGPAPGLCGNGARGLEKCAVLGVDTSDSESESSYASNHAKKKRKERASAILTEVEEDNMLEWLRKHPEIYNKKLKNYKNMPKKVALWEEKAFEMGRTVDYLKLWYRNMRTRMSRLLRTKSGQGSEVLTARDTWVMDNFSFLRVHIEAVHRRPRKSINQAPTPTVTQGHLKSETADAAPDAVVSHGETPVSATSRNTTAPIGQSTQGKQTNQDGNVLASLEDRSAQIIALQQQLMEQLRPSGDQERLGFIEWVRSTLISLNHSLWRRCQRDMTDLLYRYIEENDAAKQSASGDGSSSASTAPPPPPPTPTGPAGPPHMYPGPSSGYCQSAPSQRTCQPAAQVQNPTSAWGSVNQQWVQQHFPMANYQRPPPQSPGQLRCSLAPQTTSTSTPSLSLHVSGLSTSLL
ncbi:uncharacterized protein KZ484_019575 isoform 2-T4 [Pholidichthys leucotaenia]